MRNSIGGVDTIGPGVTMVPTSKWFLCIVYIYNSGSKLRSHAMHRWT